jgi:predicted NBD/HSP70 family sugar kinase
MDARRTTVRDMRRANRSVVLTSLYRHGPLSRQELSRQTALSQASVSNMVSELLAEGLVEEAGVIESDGGRPRTLVRVAPRFAYVVGIDIGETRVQVELFDLSMTAVAKADHAITSARPAPADVVSRALEGLDRVLREAGLGPESVLGVGVAVSGVVEQCADVVVDAQSLGWRRVPLGAMLRAGTDIPVYIDNGAKTLGQAEMWFGAGRGARHAVVALVGSGVGAAVVTDGVLYRGIGGSAGEWGHTTVSYGGRPCRCGGRGCLEAYVGAGAVLDRYRDANGGRSAPGVDAEFAFAALLAAAEESTAAADVLTDTVGYLGAGLAALVNLYNPERIVLGGWAGLALGERYLPGIRAATAAHALRQPAGDTPILLCRLGQDAVALGAATIPVARLLDEGGDPRESADRTGEPDYLRDIG